MRATYSPEDNKLRIYPEGTRVDSVLDEAEYKEFKSAGFKWAAKQECFVAPRWTPDAEDWALDLCDEIEDEDYSPEERSADRAERFTGYRDKRRDEAGAHADSFEAGPSAYGHQNRSRAERQAARHDRLRGKATTQWSKAEYWQQRTAGVISHALYRSSAHVRRGRLVRLESEFRRYGHMSDRWKAHYQLRIEYEKAMLANEGGMAGEAEMEPGGWIRPGRRHVQFGNAHVNGEGWAQILRVFKSPETGRVTSVQVMGDDRYLNDHKVKPRTISVERLGEDAYRAPTDEEREAFQAAMKERKAAEKAAKPKEPPLINPTDADAERLQALWNAVEKERYDREKRYEEFKPSEVVRMTQAHYSQLAKGSYSSCQTMDVTEKLSKYGRVVVFKVRKTSASGYSNFRADRVIVLTDKPQKPIPWEEVTEARAAQITPDKLFHRLQDICTTMGDWQKRSSEEGEKLLSDARYVGWVERHGGFTDAGRAAYAKFCEIQREGGTITETGTFYSLESVAAAR